MPRAAKVAKYAEKFCRFVESCVNAVEESMRPSLGKKKDVPKPHDAKKLKIWSTLLCAAIKGPEQYSEKIIEVGRLIETLRDTNTREAGGLFCTAIKGPEQYSKKIIEVDRLTETLRDTNTREVSDKLEVLPTKIQNLGSCR